MKIIARPQGTGKTRELLMAAYLDHAQVLTTNKRAIQAKADAYGIPDLKVIDVEDIFYENYDSYTPLYIHKITDVLQEMFKYGFDGLDLRGFSLTMEE